MNESVAHGDHVIPRKLRRLIARLWRDLVRRFTDDLDSLHQRKDQLEIMVKIGAGAAMDEPYNCACGRSTPGAQKACLGGLEAEGVMGSIEVFGQARSGAV